MKQSLLLLLACTVGCQQVGTPATVTAPPDSASGEIAFDLAGPGGAALMVPVYLNGEGPFQFVLDTGATLTCVDQQVAQALGLPAARGVVGVGAGATESGRMQLVTIDSIRVGAASVEGLTGCALDLQHTADVGLEVDGLLGLNFLRSFRMTLDFDREILRLQGAD